jgi:hypothetical protein
MKEVKAYQTSDGRTFTDKLQAIRNEFNLELRGLLQSKNPKVAAYSCPEISQLLVQNAREFTAITSKYQRLIARNSQEKTELNQNS